MKQSPGRMLTFSLLVIIGGLLQFWVAALIGLFTRPTALPFDQFVMQLFRDGGLFFFGTSLCFSSLATLLREKPLVVGSRDCNLTLLLLGFVLVTAIVGYTTFESGPLPAPPGTYSDAVKLLAQLAVTLTAITYAIFTAWTSGYFRRTP